MKKSHREFPRQTDEIANRGHACFTPKRSVALRSQMADFMAFCSRKTNQQFLAYADFEKFCYLNYQNFWHLFLQWLELSLAGDPEPVCTGDSIETALFFPRLRLNYAEQLLAGDDELAALIDCKAGQSPSLIRRGELRERVQRVAHGLTRLGVKPGDRIVAIAYNDADAVVTCLAAAAVGATFSSAAPGMAAPAILARFSQLSPTVLFTHTQERPGNHLQEVVPEVVSGLPSLHTVVVLGEGQMPACSVTTLPLAALAAHAPLPGEWPTFDFNHPLFILFSSGTTGAPKCIVHGAGGTLLEHLKELRLHCDLKAGERLFFQTSCAWMMWNWQLSALACRATIVLQDGSISGPETLWSLVANQDVAVFGTNPAYLRLCETSNYIPVNHHSLPKLRAILSTGSIIHDTQFDWIIKQVKQIPVQSISGGTDILGCFVLGNPMLPVFKGEAQCRSLGLEVDALGAAAGEIGELVCRNPFPSRPLGFFGDADGSRFHNAYFSQNAGVWTHGDRISISPEGSVRLHGRSDGVLNVRGVRVGPAEIYAAVADVSELLDVMAVEQERPDTASGSQIVLLVVLAEGVSLTGALALRLRRQIARQTSPTHVPGLILDVPDLPMTHSGKRSEVAAYDAVNGHPIRNLVAVRNPECLTAIAEHPGLRKGSAHALGGPATRSIQEVVTDLWAEALGLETVGLDDDFFDLGGNSLLAVTICTGIDEALGYDFPINALFQHPTIRSSTALLESGVVWQGNSPLVVLREGTGTPIFLLHSISGNVFEWHDVLKRLPPTRPIVALQARGLDPDVTPSARVEEMAEDYLGLIRAHQQTGPYLVMGYSFGGLLAYDIAVRLAAIGETVEFLGLIDTDVRAGSLPLTALLRYQWEQTLHRVNRAASLRLSGTLARVLRREGQAHRGTAPGSQDIQLSLPPTLRRVRTACEEAFARYDPPSYSGTVTFFRTVERRPDFCDPLIVWRRRAAEVRVISVAGTHTTVILEPDVASLAAEICRVLEIIPVPCLARSMQEVEA